MTSAINPANIMGNYPIAGVDNSSQPMRDNFTNTKLNFEIAASEITQLQNNAVLKAPLDSGTLNNDMMGALISNAVTQGFAQTAVNLGNRAGAITVNFLAGNFQSVTTSGPINLQFTNWPKAGLAGEIVVSINIANVAHTVTFPSVVTVNNVGIVGLDPQTNTFTAPVIGVYSFIFVTSNGGFTIAADSPNTILSALNSTKENLVPNTTANVAASTSYFSVNAPSGASLPVGTEGLTKTFAFYGQVGAATMTITVANPGWSTLPYGTIYFDTIGQACTLKFVNGKWFCIANNGCVFDA